MEERNRQIELLVEAARLYYEHGFSQQQIAGKMGISRPGVSRLLQRAREEGIVKIEIVDPRNRGLALEEKLKAEYRLRDVVVVPSDANSDVIKSRLGQAAASVLMKLAGDGEILAVSWGSTMLEVARRVKERPMSNMVVVQLNGGIAKAEYDTRAGEIAGMIGQKFHAIPYLLPLPAVVDSGELKNAIVADRNIAQTLELARKAKIAMFTVGSFGYDSVLVKADYFSKKDVDMLLSQGAVADICSRIIKTDGNICSPVLNGRTIGIELEELKKKPYSIAVAGGKEKLQAIKAGLEGKYFNMLITDEWVAGELLRQQM